MSITVNIIKFMFVFLILLTYQLEATGIKRPSWDANLIYISQYLKTEIVDSEKELLNCKERLADCETILLFFAKSNLKKAAKRSEYILNVPEQSEDDFFLKIRAAQVLAKNAQPNFLLEILESYDKDANDSYVLAYSNNFKYSSLIINPFMNNEFCFYSGFINPFLNNRFQDKEKLISTIISKILGGSLSEHKCAIQIIAKNKHILNDENLEIIYKKLIDVFNKKDHEKIKQYFNFINIWYSKFNNKNKLTQQLLEYSKSQDNTARTKLEEFLTRNNLSINKKTNKTRKKIVNKKPQGFLEKVDINSYLIKLSPVEFMLQKPFEEDWNIYFNELNEYQLVKLTSKMVIKSQKITDQNRKLKFIFKHNLFKNSYVAQVLISDSLVNEFPLEVKNIVTRLYGLSSELQKTTMIAKYPQLLSSKPIVRVTTNDPWIKLAELTNLLTICKIETPPVGTELSDPEKLTKYLEDAEILIKDCSRVNQ